MVHTQLMIENKTIQPKIQLRVSWVERTGSIEDNTREKKPTSFRCNTPAINSSKDGNNRNSED